MISACKSTICRSDLFLGSIPDYSDMPLIYAIADVVVVPSVWLEPMGLIVCESMACGKPVIGSNLGGIPEMVIENETGLIFEQGNYQELRQEIEFLISSPSVVIEMGKKARKKVEKEYNSEIVYQKLIEVYERACS